MTKVSKIDALKYVLTLAYSMYVLMHAKLDSMIGVLVLIANLRVSDYLLFDGIALRTVYKKLKLTAPLKLNMGLVNGVRLLPKVAIVAALIVYVHSTRLLALQPAFNYIDSHISLRSHIGIDLSGILAPFILYIVLPLYTLDYFVLDNAVLSKLKTRLAALGKKQVAARKRRI